MKHGGRITAKRSGRMRENMKLGFELTEVILGCCFEVANELGIGFLESVYKNALVIALKDAGLNTVVEKPFEVKFRGKAIGIFIADLIVQEKVIVEVKGCKALLPEHQAQLINYLKITGIIDGLLINFGTKKIEIKRLLHPENFTMKEEEILF